jgi:hypothetical protein
MMRRARNLAPRTKDLAPRIINAPFSPRRGEKVPKADEGSPLLLKSGAK